VVTSDAGLREPERWHVHGRPEAPVLDAWADVLAATHLSFDVRSTERTPPNFEASVAVQRFGGLALTDCESSPWLGNRSTAIMDDEAGAIVGFQMLRRGVEQVRMLGQEPITLTPGDMILWNGWEPVEVEVIEPFAKRTLIFPRERVLAVCPRFHDLDELPPLRQTPAARLLVRYLDALAMELPSLDASADAAAAEAALELLRAAIEPSAPTSRESRRTAMLAEIRRYVRLHLQDPALGPEAIARAHAISVRALHALFEDSAESVAGLVRRERLARCMGDLQLTTGGSVTEIAFRWGFRDAAHFSRVFKREFGATPSEVRAGACESEAELALAAAELVRS
jgi:AraC family transcriptional activator of tynA and feaB